MLVSDDLLVRFVAIAGIAVFIFIVNVVSILLKKLFGRNNSTDYNSVDGHNVESSIRNNDAEDGIIQNESTSSEIIREDVVPQTNEEPIISNSSQSESEAPKKDYLETKRLKQGFINKAYRRKIILVTTSFLLILSFIVIAISLLFPKQHLIEHTKGNNTYCYIIPSSLMNDDSEEGDDTTYDVMNADGVETWYLKEVFYSSSVQRRLKDAQFARLAFEVTDHNKTKENLPIDNYRVYLNEKEYWLTSDEYAPRADRIEESEAKVRRFRCVYSKDALFRQTVCLESLQAALQHPEIIVSEFSLPNQYIWDVDVLSVKSPLVNISLNCTYDDRYDYGDDIWKKKEGLRQGNRKTVKMKCGNQHALYSGYSDSGNYHAELQICYKGVLITYTIKGQGYYKHFKNKRDCARFSKQILKSIRILSK